MQGLLLIALGGAAGSVLRYLGAGAATRAFGLALPWGTLAVNVAGGVMIGMLAHLLPLLGGWQKEARVLLVTGLLGGFTTFSAFSLEVFMQIERGEWAHAGAYIALSVVGAVAGVWLGVHLARVIA